MKQLLVAVITVFGIQHATGQCVSGDCNNGRGKFDFGWCIYEGDFKNGKPDGDGLMVYDDYTYKGHFTAGKENGHGTITYKKGGRIEEVNYNDGVKTNAPVKQDSSEWKVLQGYDPNCISGNCFTGWGTYVFESGNKYVGNFKEYRREGQGTFYFSDGDRFEGLFHNNERAQGTYFYKNTGATYTGTYDEQGKELNGAYQGAGGYTIACINGKAIIPKEALRSTSKAPVSSSAKQQEKAREPETMICSACHGTGKTYESYYGYSTGSEKKYGVTTYRSSYSSCTACNGSGTVKIKF